MNQKKFGTFAGVLTPSILTILGVMMYLRFGTVVGNAGLASLACVGGGDYFFDFSTFANYWNNSFRVFPTVLIDNYIDLEIVSFDMTMIIWNVKWLLGLFYSR